MSGPPPGPTRREALLLAGGGLAWALGACGATPPPPGSTLARSLVDPDGDGLLAQGAAVPLRDRVELGGGGRPGRPLVTLAQLTDPHVRDAQSPARVPFLDRLGPRLGGAFRPQETLTTQVLAATVASINTWGEADAVLVTGDLIDSAQHNELDWALTLLEGGTVAPNSGGRGYAGVQEATNPDPLYYRPDVDAPRHPGLLRRALVPVHSHGLDAPWWPAFGNHDLLVQGELAPSPAITAVATGERLLLAPQLDLARLARGGSIDRAEVDALLRAGIPGDALRVAPDPRRVHLSAADTLTRVRAAARGTGTHADRLDYVIDVGERLRVIVLDLARRDAGSDGLVTEATLTFLSTALAQAGERYLLIACHQPLDLSAGGGAVFALLDPDPRVVAVLAGHTHRNEIAPRHARGGGGYWLVTTSSIVDFPQQWRALRLVETRGGGVALETWMVDHAGRPNDDGDLAGIARDLAFLDPQGGRPVRAAGPPSARNVRLHLSRRPLRPARRPPRRPALPAPSPATADGGAGDAFG